MNVIAVGANKNDNTIFKETVIDGVKCIKQPAKKPKYLLSDAGPDSHESNELVLGYGIIPVIAARENSVGKMFCFYFKYYCYSYWPDCM